MQQLTQYEINQLCKKFQPGDKVVITEYARSDDGKKGIGKVNGTVISRSSFSILIATGKEYHERRTFTYAEIALTGCVEKKKGRPSKV